MCPKLWVVCLSCGWCVSVVGSVSQLWVVCLFWVVCPSCGLCVSVVGGVSQVVGGVSQL